MSRSVLLIIATVLFAPSHILISYRNAKWTLEIPVYLGVGSASKALWKRMGALLYNSCREYRGPTEPILLRQTPPWLRIPGYCQVYFANSSLTKWNHVLESGGGAATLRLIAWKHMPEAESRAAKPFISTLDSVGGICYVIVVWWMGLCHFCCGFSQIFHTKIPLGSPLLSWHIP